MYYSLVYRPLLAILSLVSIVAHAAVPFEPELSPFQPNLQLIWERAFASQIEDIVSRSGHPDQLIITLAMPPEIHLIDLKTLAPYAINRTRIYTSPRSQAILGITEVYPDVYAFIAGNTLVFPYYKVFPGIHSLYLLNLTTFEANNTGWTTNRTAVVTKLADLQANNPSSIATLPGKNPLLLIADSTAGSILAVNPKTGEQNTLYTHESMQPLPNAPEPVGVKAFRVLDKYIYYGNHFSHALYRLPIDVDNTAADSVNIRPTIRTTGEPQLMVQDRNFPRADGLAVRYRGTEKIDGALEIIVTGSNSVVKVEHTVGGGWAYHFVSRGWRGSNSVRGATNAAFGVGDWVQNVFITTGGGVAADIFAFFGPSRVLRIGI